MIGNKEYASHINTCIDEEMIFRFVNMYSFFSETKMKSQIHQNKSMEFANLYMEKSIFPLELKFFEKMILYVKTNSSYIVFVFANDVHLICIGKF